MTWLERLARFLDIDVDDAALATPQDAETRDPSLATTREGTFSLAEEDRLWRSISNSGLVEPPWHALQEQMLDATEAYRANPLAFRIVELTADHVLGRGLKLTSPDRRAQAWLDDWWNHPENRMQTRTYDLCRELSICGEIFVTFHPQPDGMVVIRQVPPMHIDTIETDPEDLERELRFHDSGSELNVAGGKWWTADEMAHYAVNRLAGCVRGQSDLGPALPWLRRYKDWLTDRVRINRFKGAFLWWVKLPGADRATVEQKRLELTRPPESGSVIVTNEAEEWSAVQPKIDAQDVEADGRAIRMMLAAGSGIPLHFLAEPESTNRATAAEMQSPTLRHFESRQVVFGIILADIARHACALSGQFTGDLKIRALFEDLSTADNARIATAAGAMVNALAIARDRNWIDDKQAKAVLQTYIGVKQESEA